MLEGVLSEGRLLKEVLLEVLLEGADRAGQALQNRLYFGHMLPKIQVLGIFSSRTHSCFFSGLPGELFLHWLPGIFIGLKDLRWLPGIFIGLKDLGLSRTDPALQNPALQISPAGPEGSP